MAAFYNTDRKERTITDDNDIVSGPQQDKLHCSFELRVLKYLRCTHMTPFVLLRKH